MGHRVRVFLGLADALGDSFGVRLALRIQQYDDFFPNGRDGRSFLVDAFEQETGRVSHTEAITLKPQIGHSDART